ncbi:unnamed protein product [Calypogeia fissa]
MRAFWQYLVILPSHEVVSLFFTGGRKRTPVRRQRKNKTRYRHLLWSLSVTDNRPQAVSTVRPAVYNSTHERELVKADEPARVLYKQSHGLALAPAGSEATDYGPDRKTQTSPRRIVSLIIDPFKYLRPGGVLQDSKLVLLPPLCKETLGATSPSPTADATGKGIVVVYRRRRRRGRRRVFYPIVTAAG